MRKLKSFLGAATAIALASTAFTASYADDVAIIGGTAFTNGGKGKVENATILISDGKVISVVGGGAVPESFRKIDAAGKWVTSGFMVSGGSLGMGEVGSWADNNDASAAKAKDGVGLDVKYSLNPKNTKIAITRIEGVTRALTHFTSTKDNWIGTGAVIKLDGDTAEEMITRNGAIVYLDVDEGAARSNGGSRSAMWPEVYKKLKAAKPADETEEKSDDDAEEDGKKDSKKAKEKSAGDKALASLFDGSAVLLVNAFRASDIEEVIKLKSEFGLNVVLTGAAEAWLVADKVAAAGIPVVLNPLSNLPGRFDYLAATGKNAARLHEAGVKIAFLAPGTANSRLVTQSAGNAVAMGLPWDAAVNALTVNPAEMFGVADSYGTISSGKDADIVVWNGDPLEVMSSPDTVFVAGEEVDLVSRQTKLRDRYKNIPRAPGLK